MADVVAVGRQVREVPAVAAVIGGRPVNLFLGIPADDEIRRASWMSCSRSQTQKA